MLCRAACIALHGYVFGVHIFYNLNALLLIDIEWKILIDIVLQHFFSKRSMNY